MGGMIAVEIANHLSSLHTIIISSIPVSNQLPFYFRVAARLYLHRFIPIRLVKNAAIAKRLFTTETKEDKEMLKTIIRESDPNFIKWAIHAILQWENDVARKSHSHSRKQMTLLLKYTKPTHIISKAGHLMY
jgi:hypothetical protein